MKKIEAIIRKTKFEDVREAMVSEGIEWFSYSEVRGVGKSRQERIYRGVVYDTSYIERIQIEIVLSDESVKPVVNAIAKAAHTGEIGDGRIFVYPVEEAHRIRLGASYDKTQYVEVREEKTK
ncbi:MAG: P-II family nitrogen regulator [Rikenellaceae bacterium]